MRSNGSSSFSLIYLTYVFLIFSTISVLKMIGFYRTQRIWSINLQLHFGLQDNGHSPIDFLILNTKRSVSSIQQIPIGILLKIHIFLTSVSLLSGSFRRKHCTLYNQRIESASLEQCSTEFNSVQRITIHNETSITGCTCSFPNAMELCFKDGFITSSASLARLLNRIILLKQIRKLEFQY